MASAYEPRSRITYDRFGRAWVVAYRNPDGSEYGSLLRTSSASGAHHRSYAHHHSPVPHPPHKHAASPSRHHTTRHVHPSLPSSRYNAWSGERVDLRDGTADSPLAQALFHSRAGGGQWGASYRFVRNATAVYSLLIFFAFTPALMVEATLGFQVALRPGVIIFAPLYGRYLATATGASSAVLGRYPYYLEVAEEMGANVFKMPMRVWSTLDWFEASWASNTAFIDRVVGTGQSIYLATSPYGQEGSIFEQELLYLNSLGVESDMWLRAYP